VGEQIVAAFVRGDKAKTFCIVEPFHYTGSHLHSFLKQINPDLRPVGCGDIKDCRGVLK
jgi:hypothetical protein